MLLYKGEICSAGKCNGNMKVDRRDRSSKINRIDARTPLVYYFIGDSILDMEHVVLAGSHYWMVLA